ncbi:MAG: arginine--tRNA ligase [Candidatus Gracilibacteria bacterium]|nr:arginine--tRNA ligase [Candidatus Gracilibacteria bacterium]
MDVKYIVGKEIKNLIKNNFNIELEEIKLEIPPKNNLGDYCFGAFALSKILKKKPQEIAESIKEVFEKSEILSDINIAGVFINFRVSEKVFASEFKNAYLSRETFGYNGKGTGKHIIVDYIGANVGKPLHIGHMCTPNQGQAMINLYRHKFGYNVISDTHLGDWGIIFGKLITAYKLWGDEAELEKDAVNYLLKLYVKISTAAKEDEKLEQRTRDEFKLLSEGNKESIDLWAKFTSFSIDRMQKTLDRMKIIPDYNIGESFYEGLNLPKMGNFPDLKNDMHSIVKELIEKKIATKNEDGSVGVIFPEETKIPSCILQKRDGTHGYLASDLACVKYRLQNWSRTEKVIYFIDVRQSLHLKQVFEISKMAGFINPEKTELIHAPNGFISLKEGAMSTRSGNIILLDKLLDEAISRAKNIILEKRQDIEGEELEKLSETIGIGAIKYGYLSKNRTTDVIFDWDEFMTFEGNSGPYIAYAHVRANKLINDSKIKDFDKYSSYTFALQEEKNLIKMIFEYEQVILDTAKNNTPHLVAAYAYNLTKTFNSFYNNVKILIVMMRKGN